MRKPVAPSNLRNGLKWRSGRPRWEPSPKARALGLKGRDLRRPDGDWMNRGEAIAAADARHLWASFIREAHQEGPAGADARRDLREALGQLGPDLTPQRQVVADLTPQRLVVADLIAQARDLVANRTGEGEIAGGYAPKTVKAMVVAYFAALENREPYFCGERGELKLSDSTVVNYRNVSGFLIAKFGDRRVDELTRGDMKEWYDELVRNNSLSVANLRLGCASAFFRWATLQRPPWIVESPCVKLRRAKAKGRRVFWEPEEEAAFVAWCDANGYPDVADAVVFGIWTGARPFDLCAANLEDLRGDTWRYTPHKTARRSGREALPGLAPNLRDRIERRWGEVAASAVTFAGGRPFLWNLAEQARFTTRSLHKRFTEARAAALLADAIPTGVAEKKGQDWRDTCITRLWEADVGLDRIPSWTGHAPDEAGEILRDHYIALRDSQARETLRRLEAYMARQGVKV
jgi:integrase